MQRVMIIGSGGAGKSWLSCRLGEVTGLPVIHLDREHWQPGWVEPPTPVWEARIRELVAADRWILDGNYGGTMEPRMERADTIIFLDVTRMRAIAGVVRRRIRGNRVDIAPGCPEQLDLDFVRWIWKFPEKRRPKILELLERYRPGRAIHILRDRSDVTRFLESLPTA